MADTLQKIYLKWRIGAFNHLRMMEKQPRKLVYIEQYKALILGGIKRYEKLVPKKLPEEFKIARFSSVVAYTMALATTAQAIEDLTAAEFEDLEK